MSKKIEGCVFSGDQHLRPQTWARRPEIHGDAYSALVQIIAYCVQHNRALMMMGDLFNSEHPDSRSVEVFRASMDTMEENELPVYAIQGQHDMATPPWPVSLHSYVQYVSGKTFHPIPDGPEFYAFDRIANPEVIKNDLNIPSTAVGLVGHQLAREVFPMEGRWDFDASCLPSTIKYLFLGDFHEPVTFGIPGGRGWYSGSMYLCKIDEPTEKSFLDVKHHDIAGLSVERIPLKSRQYIKYTINQASELDAVVGILTEAKLEPDVDNQQPVVVVEYLAEVLDVVPRLEAAIAGRAYLWPKPVSSRIVWDDGKAQATTEHQTMESCIQKYHPPTSREHQFLTDLLKRPDTDKVLAEWREKMGVTLAA